MRIGFGEYLSSGYSSSSSSSSSVGSRSDSEFSSEKFRSSPLRYLSLVFVKPSLQSTAGSRFAKFPDLRPGKVVGGLGRKFFLGKKFFYGLYFSFMAGQGVFLKFWFERRYFEFTAVLLRRNWIEVYGIVVW